MPEPTERPTEAEPEEEPTEEQAPAISGEVLWWAVAEYNFEEVWPDIVEAYNEIRPDVEITTEVFPEDAYHEKLLPALIAGEGGPDIFKAGLIPAEQVPDVASDLTPLVERDAIDTEAYFDQEAWKMSLIDGRIHGLPNTIHGGDGWFYNKDLFDQFGVPYPEEGWTWSDMLEIAPQLTDKENRLYGVAVGDFVIYPQLGFDILGPDRRTLPGYLDSDAAIEAFTFLKTLYDCCSPTLEQQGTEFQDVTGGGTGPVGAFLSGQVAMAQVDLGTFPQLDEAGINWGYINPPAPDNPESRHKASRGYAEWRINKQTQNLEAAWDFLKWLTAEDGGAPFMAKAGYPVPYPDVWLAGGYPNKIVDAYFTPDPEEWKPAIKWPFEYPCTWEAGLLPMMNATSEIFDSPAGQLEEILHKWAEQGQEEMDACLELEEAGGD